MCKAKFIVIEGIDGSGTTTQTKKLANYFKNIGKKIYSTAEPSNNPTGLLIRKFLKENNKKNCLFRKKQLALLYAADRLEHYALEIGVNLKMGINVICDRYLMSTLVYQGFDLNENWIKSLNKYVPLPDLTILIDVHEDIALLRRNKRGNDFEFFDNFKFQKNMRQRYLSLAKKLKIKIIDGNKDKIHVLEEILTCFEIN